MIKIKQLAFKEALSEAAKNCSNAKCKAICDGKRLPHGTFNKIIKETETKYMLEKGSIKFQTKKSQFFSNNLTSVQHQKISPIVKVEPLIVKCCVALSTMGEAMTKFEVMDLADKILSTIHADWLVDFCIKRKIWKYIRKGKIVGQQWYPNFMRRHSDKIKCKPCQLQDQNQLTWCTSENFENMYNAEYKAMVEAMVAIKHDEEIMLDCDGNITNNKDKMVGRKTRYQLTKPEQCVYVDKTGCNTNMKDDGHVGGRQYVMSVDQVEGDQSGVTRDIHFTVLAYTSGTGEVIMCAIILKSEKPVNEIPISWKLGIDVSKDVQFSKWSFNWWKTMYVPRKKLTLFCMYLPKRFDH
jgi:hypothetical protein